VLAEAKILHARFVLRDGAGAEADLAWDFPVDSWGIREAPPLRILKVHAVVDADGRIRCGEFGSAEPAAFRRFLGKATARIAREGLDGLAGEIQAAGPVPWGRCAAVFELLLEAGAEHVDFYGVAIPGPVVRQKKTLPEPPKADRLLRRGGLTEVGAWRDAGRLTYDLPEEEIVEEPIPD
jgi:hypothetical protein